MLDDLPQQINDSEKHLTTLTQLGSGYCKRLGSYKSRIKKDASLNVCADYGKTPHGVKHVFVYPAHLTTLIPADLWSNPMDSIREFSYLEAENLDWDEPRPKANNNNNQRKFYKLVNSLQGRSKQVVLPPHDDPASLSLSLCYIQSLLYDKNWYHSRKNSEVNCQTSRLFLSTNWYNSWTN